MYNYIVSHIPYTTYTWYHSLRIICFVVRCIMRFLLRSNSAGRLEHILGVFAAFIFPADRKEIENGKEDHTSFIALTSIQLDEIYRSMKRKKNGDIFDPPFFICTLIKTTV